MEGVYGTVGNLFKTNEKYGIAIEVTAGSQINDIIVENEDVAKFCIDYLKREKIGRATFLPLNKIKSKNVPVDLLGKKGVIGLASKLIKFDSRYKPAMDFVFGSTLIIDDLDAAKNIGIGKARMVSLEGDLVERSGAMIGGYYVKHPQFAKETAGKEISEYERMKKSLEEEIENLKKEIEEFENKLKEYGQTEETKRIIDLEKLKIDSQADIDEMRNKRKILYEKRLAVQSEINRLNILKAKLDAELENVKIEIQQYGDIKPIEKAISTLQKKVRDIERELLLLGPVNFKAIEQYEKFKSEFDHYKEKYEKILEEKKAVMEMIDKIEEKRREVFYRCLKKVSENFDRIFQIMTNGSARVELENPLELESGLIIEANPAGKMLLNIDSMSGGEKTLTALAFLFAVQQYQPAPFYILDEADAALDKENSKKVAELIKKLSMENQFIVITHNDTTIKYGDCIYGVTMDRGESKILGIELPGE